MADWFAESVRGESVRTTADGVFLLEGIPGGAQTAVIMHDDYIPEYRQGLDVRLGEQLDLTVSLRRGLSLSGRVIDAAGTAAARGAVR